MQIENYKTLISSLPVKQQCFTTKQQTWKDDVTNCSWLIDFNNQLFNGESELTISRQDIFNTKELKEIIIKTIYWGYPRGMRGKNFGKILLKFNEIVKILQKLKSNPEIDFKDICIDLKSIEGLGISTFSKLLYFQNIKLNKLPCLILDQRLIDTFNSGIFDEFISLKNINYNNATDNYIDYLNIVNDLSLSHGIKGENIEMFLFLFGKNLK